MKSLASEDIFCHIAFLKLNYPFTIFSIIFLSLESLKGGLPDSKM